MKITVNKGSISEISKIIDIDTLIYPSTLLIFGHFDNLIHFGFVTIPVFCTILPSFITS